MATNWFNRKRTDEENAESSRLYRLGGIGAEFAGAVMGMTLIGYLLDLWWGTAPPC
jgi:F0F1-type ATP synthase assembly protein I